MIDYGNILTLYHIQAKRQQEALQKEALRPEYVNQQRKNGFEMGDSAVSLKSDLVKTIRGIVAKNRKTGGQQN